MSGQADRAETFLALHDGERAAAASQSVGPGLGEAARLARLRGAGDDERRLRGDAGPAGRVDGASRRRSQRRRDRRGDRAAGVRRPRERLRRRPPGVAETMRLALDAGLAGARSRTTAGARRRRSTTSTSPPSGWPRRPRPRTAADRGWSSQRGPRTTCAASTDLADTIARLQAYQEAGADVLYAPGLARLEDIRQLVSSVDLRSTSSAGPAPLCGGAGCRRVRASRSAAPSPTPRSARRSKLRGSCSTRGPTAISSGPASACRRLVRPSRNSRACGPGLGATAPEPLQPQPWIFSPRSSMPTNFRSRRSRVSGFFASSSR